MSVKSDFEKEQDWQISEKYVHNCYRWQYFYEDDKWDKASNKIFRPKPLWIIYWL